MFIHVAVDFGRLDTVQSTKCGDLVIVSFCRSDCHQHTAGGREGRPDWWTSSSLSSAKPWWPWWLRNSLWAGQWSLSSPHIKNLADILKSPWTSWGPIFYWFLCLVYLHQSGWWEMWGLPKKCLLTPTHLQLQWLHWDLPGPCCKTTIQSMIPCRMLPGRRGEEMSLLDHCFHLVSYKYVYLPPKNVRYLPQNKL